MNPKNLFAENWLNHNLLITCWIFIFITIDKIDPSALAIFCFIVACVGSPIASAMNFDPFNILKFFRTFIFYDFAITFSIFTRLIDISNFFLVRWFRSSWLQYRQHLSPGQGVWFNWKAPNWLPSQVLKNIKNIRYIFFTFFPIFREFYLEQSGRVTVLSLTPPTMDGTFGPM